MTDAYDPYAALKLPNFRLFLAGRLSFTLALQIQAVIVSWQIFDITKNPLSLGLIGLAEAIPSITVALYAGHVADITSRKKIITTVLAILIFCSASLLFFTLDLTPESLHNKVIPIYTIIFISGAARGFLGPAVFSFMPQIIHDKKLYSNAVTWNSVLWQGGSVAGPALGGLIYAYFGVSASYATDFSLTLISLIVFSFIPSFPLPEIPAKQSVIKSLKEGIRFVFSNQIILSAISLDLFAVLFGGAVALLPIFASEILKTGPEGLGLMRAAPSVGSALMMIYMTYNPMHKSAGKKMLFCVAGFGLCMILFGISKSFYFSLFILALSGAFDSISVIIRSTLIQLHTPESMKGRVSSVNNIFIGSSNEIGSFESGVAAKLMGVVTSVVFGGGMTMAIVSFTAWKADQLRKLDL